ncbi:hypothetical protein [Streptomyces werraensis]|uniref:hypothetical protein n=1 Tax=Streptomyces werraensis TaxID=68284 RepID=UPI0034302C8C
MTRRRGRANARPGPCRDRNGVARTDEGATSVPESHGGVDGPGGRPILRGVDGDLIVHPPATA